VILKNFPFTGTGIDLDRWNGEIFFRSTDLLRINTKRLQVTSAVEIPPWGGLEMVVDPRTGRAFLAGGLGLWIYEKDGTLVAQHSEGGYIYQYLASDVSRRQVYVVRNEDPRIGTDSRLDIVSMDTGEVLATFYMHTSSYRPVVDVKTGAVWVTNASNSYIEIVYGDTHGTSWIAPPPGIDMYPADYIVAQSMVMLPRARRAYAVTNVWGSGSCEAESMIRVFELDREIELDPISLADLECDSDRFEHIAINPLNQRLYATLAEVNGLSNPTLVVLDTVDGSLSEVVLPYRYSLRDISVDPWRRRIFVPAFNRDAFYDPGLAYNQVLVFSGKAGAEQLLDEIDIDADFVMRAKLDPRTGRLFAPTAGGLVVIGDRWAGASMSDHNR
jgi:hypothetical protein